MFGIIKRKKKVNIIEEGEGEDDSADSLSGYSDNDLGNDGKTTYEHTVTIESETPAETQLPPNTETVGAGNTEVNEVKAITEEVKVVKKKKAGKN